MTIGHNSIEADSLKSFVARIERMDDDISNLQADRRDIYTEAKSAGFDLPALRRLISLRAMDQVERKRIDEIVDLYLHALGDAK